MVVAVSSSAIAKNQNHWYVGTGIGVLATVKDATSGLGLALKGGVTLDSVLPNLGAEVEFNKSLVNPEYGSIQEDVATLAGYFTYNIALGNSPISVRPKFGVILPNLGDAQSVNSRNLGFSTGVAGVLTINKNLNAYLDYTNLGEKINNYSVGVEFHF